MERIAGLLVLAGVWMLVAIKAEEDYGQTRTYIVHMEQTAVSRYSQLLQTVKQTFNGESGAAPLHVYSSACHGFSAQLTPQEAEALKRENGVLAVHPDSKVSLHTTRTPEFLGLTTLRGLWPDSHFGDDMIIGVIDSGIWPERDSFSDTGLGPIPARWKGACEYGFTCNKKLIGARYYYTGFENEFFPLNFTQESKSPRDTDGHGTHTASTAAGSAVRDANVFGLANGTARGMAPNARIAVYKVCWTNGDCARSDILAAIDQAVADGVNVISLSLGDPVVPLNQDPLAIGAFGAMRKGIFVSCSAGNAGPALNTTTNIAPWVMTVAASTLDRAFPGNVELGDGQILHGQVLYNGSGGVPAELITGADAAILNVTDAALCLENSLNSTLVKGKIVVCNRGPNRVAKGAVVLAAGGAGMILMNLVGESVLADAHVLPATHIGARDGAILLTYMASTPNPLAIFQFLGTQYNVHPAPVVAGFSSRGPNALNPEILKPDITAPGVNILAAWTGDTKFNSISGTSMSCPHISGLAALLKGAHPTWSPGAIKSAMMTTASRVANTGLPITDGFTLAEGTPFLYGSGHVQPAKALDPGLIYDLGFQDYINFLCASNYSAQDLKLFIHEETIGCSEGGARIEDLNYPSFSAVFKEPPPISINMTRTVTNVGLNGNVTYSARILAPSGFHITVYPEVLRFSAKNETKSFTLQVTTEITPNATSVDSSVTKFAFLEWTDGLHVVQSPIAITVQK